jgi:preprotein translocase subunit YajC
MPKRKTALYITLIALLVVLPATSFAQDGNAAAGEELGTAKGEDDATAADENGDGPTVEKKEEPTTQPGDTGGGGGGGGFLGQWQFPLILLGVLVLMYIFTTRTRRKQEKQRREMLESLSKGDKVVTIGGICGTVIDVKGNEVTVKVDENNNVRMKFTRWAVRNVGDEAKEEDPTQR